jgi:hypothetical protein
MMAVTGASRCLYGDRSRFAEACAPSGALAAETRASLTPLARRLKAVRRDDWERWPT